MVSQQFFPKDNMKIGLTVRRENEGFFIRERYIKYFSDFEVVFLTPYNIDYACDAYAILGGNDANPKLYNEENTASEEIDDLIDELDMKVIDFCQKSYLCVADPDAFLRADYGDYMQLPPEEERVWKHHPIIIDFEHNYEELI